MAQRGKRYRRADATCNKVLSMNLPVFCGAASLFDRIIEQGGDTLFPVMQGFGPQHFPPLQIFEDEQTLYVRACIPGVSLDELSLTLKGRALFIEGRVPLPEGRPLRRERSCGAFKRKVQLPCGVESGGAEAVMRDGLLTVTLGKAAHKCGKRTIPVECAAEDPERRSKP